MAELGTVTQALLAGGDDGVDEHAVDERICRACVTGLDVDGAVISMLTATVSREACGPPTRRRSCWRNCSSP